MRSPVRVTLSLAITAIVYGSLAHVTNVHATNMHTTNAHITNPHTTNAQVGTAHAGAARMAIVYRESGATMGMRPDTTRTTMDGVYTLQQAMKGKDVFAAYCITCHTPTVHSGPPFRSKWFGRPLSDLFSYIQRAMPKTSPGSISDADYARALAYLLRINGMPAGSIPLAADSTALHRIRLDSVSAGSTASDTRP